MFALLLLLLPSLCQSLPHSQELKNCDSSGPRVSALSLNSALSTFLCYTEKELAAMEEEQKKRKLALKIAPSIRHAESGGFEKLVEVLTDMKEEDLVKIVNVVINNESNEGERKTLPEYIQVIQELIGETGVESELAKNLHLVSLLKSDLEDQGRGGRGAFGNFVLSILGMPPLFPDGKDDESTSTTLKPTTVAPGSTAASTTATSATGGSTAASSTGGSTATSTTGGSTAVTTTATSSTGGSTAASTTGGSTAASTTVGSTASTAASTAGASTAASTIGASTAASTTGASTASSTAAASTTAVSTAASTTVASTTGATTASTTVASTAASTTVASTTGAITASTTVASTAASTTASTTGTTTSASTTVSTTAASTAASTTVASTVATTTAAPPTCPGNSDEVSAVDCDCGGNLCTGGTQGCETPVSLCRDVCSTVDAPITGNDPCFCKLQGSSAADLCAVGQTCSSTTGLCT